MCNEYHQRVKRGEIPDQFSQNKIPFSWADAEPNRDLDTPFKPTNRATIIRPVDPANPRAGVEGLDIRWWLVPWFHKGPLKALKAMATNARIETVDTSPTFREPYKKQRCLVPLTSFIEYSEPAGWRKGQPKQRNEITWRGEDVRYFAGLWERSTPEDYPDGLQSFAFVTGPAPPDVAPIHDRTPPVLTLEQGLQWLDLDGPGKAPLFDLPPPGTYDVQVRMRESIMSAEMRRSLL